MELYKENWSGKVAEVRLGATAAEGGTRSHQVVVGGQNTLPFLTFEGVVPNPPAVFGEIADREPEWPENLKEAFGDDLKDPVAWARRWVDEYGATGLCLRLVSADPEGENASAEAVAAGVRKVLEAVKVPLIIIGTEDAERDNEIFPAVAEAAQGERVFLGPVTRDNYKSIAAAAILHHHGVIAQAPVDVNIQKQTNILLMEFGLKAEDIMMDPTTGGLGYGLEYTYSVMERLRLGALQGESKVAVPIVVYPGQESWRAKEAREPASVRPEWGDVQTRGVLWELLTATNSLQAGADLLVCRHPEAARRLKEHIHELITQGSEEVKV